MKAILKNAKTPLFLWMAICLLTGCGPAIDLPEPDLPKNDWEFMGLKGRVKKITGSPMVSLHKDFKIQNEYPQSSTQYLFNKRGFIKESLRTNKAGAVLHKKVMIYKENGAPSAEIGYDHQGALTGKKIFHFDTDGRIDYTENYNARGKLKSKTVLTRAMPGRITRSDSYDADGNLTGKIIYKYDRKGEKVTRKFYNANGKLQQTFVGIEDDNFRLIEFHIKVVNRQKSVYKYRYKNDKKGNWIEKTMLLNDFPVAVEHRDYEYFTR